MCENFVLSCCSTVDLTPELLEQRGIRYAHFHYLLDHKEYDDDMGKTISMEDFYKAMVGGADAHTAQINVEEYCRYFTPFLEAGQDVLHLTLSSGLSGSYNSARIAIPAAAGAGGGLAGRLLRLRAADDHAGEPAGCGKVAG